MLYLIVIVAFVTTPEVYSLEKWWLKQVQNSNCNKSQLHSKCPPWFYTSDDGKLCLEGRKVKKILHINSNTLQTSIQPFYCMTQEGNKSVLGGCLYTAIHKKEPFIPLPCNVSDLNAYMCAGLNREGQLCGRCKNGFSPAVYSYSMKCVQSKSCHLNWIKYIIVAFGPLTVFLIIVTTCHISPLSPYFHGYMLFSQVITLAPLMRISSLGVEYEDRPKTQYIFGILMSFFSMWNLDFFRILYTPFCIKSKFTTLHVIFLDYIIAFYPLVLLLLVFITIKLYSHSFKPVVYFWRKVRPFVLFTKELFKIETSFINSFATILFLTANKLQIISFDLLLPTTVSYNHGPQRMNKYFLYLAGNVNYFGREHLPYGVFAFCILILLVIFPVSLMFLYPCICFQKLLNKKGWNSLALKTFMDAYQGAYKDGTNNTRDYRYFSGIFFLTRTSVIITIASLNSFFSVTAINLIFVALTLSLAILHPHKSHFSQTTDCLFTSALAVLALFIVIDPNLPNEKVYFCKIIAYALGILLPFLYIFGLMMIWLLVKVKLPQRTLQWIHKKTISIKLHSKNRYLPIQ